MQTLIIYFDSSRKNYQRVTPTADFMRDKGKEGRKPTQNDWQTLAHAIGGNYYSFAVVGD